MKQHRLTAPLGLFGGQAEQVQRAFHVHLVRHLGGELGAGGEQRRQVVDGGDLVLADQAGQQGLIHQIALDMGRKLGVFRREGPQVEGDIWFSPWADKDRTRESPISPAAPVMRMPLLRIFSP